MMKKWFVGLALVLCLVLCCAWGSAEDTVHVTDFQEFLNALNADASSIALDNSITFESDVTINHDVKIIYGNDVSILGSDYTLTINGCTVTMGEDVAGTTGRSFDGNVYVDVVNHGKLQGSTTFQGKVTNYGEIAAAHCFLGEYENQEGGTNSSYVYLEFDFGGVVVQEYESTGSGGTTIVRENIIYGTVICGQKPKNGISFENTDRWVSDIVKLDGSQLVVTRKGFDLTWRMGDNEFNINEPLVSASTNNVIISADWRVKEGYTLHTLTFDANGGEGTMEPLQFVAGDTLKLRNGTTFSRKTAEGSNYNFLGWNTAPDGKGHAYSSKGETITFGDEDVTLYAQWTTVIHSEGVFSVTYHSKDSSDTWYIVETDGSLAFSDSPREVKSSDYFTSMTPPSDDMVFAGWSFDDTGSEPLLQAGDKVTLIDGGDGNLGVHLYAVWADPCTVTFLDGFGGTTTATVASGQKATKPASPTHEGFTFQHWSKQGETTAFNFGTSITANTTLVAQWDAIPVSNASELRDAVASNPGKPIRLTDNITLTNNLTLGNDVTLDLNGHDLNGNGNTIIVDESCTLSLLDSTSFSAYLKQATVACAGTLKLQGTIVVRATVELGENGSIVHTEYNDTLPKLGEVHVQNSSQLESLLKLYSPNGAYFSMVVLDQSFTLENDATLPALATLNLNGHTLSGSKTLTLASRSVLTDVSNPPAGCVTCKVNKNEGADTSAVEVTVSFASGTPNNPAIQKIIRGQKATEPTVSYDGFTFLYWSEKGETTEFSFDTLIMDNTALMAQWKDYILVSNEDELKAALELETDKTIRLTKDIFLSNWPKLEHDATIDLHTFNINGGETYYLEVDPGVTLTLYTHGDAARGISLLNNGTLKGNAILEGDIANHGTIENMPTGEKLTFTAAIDNYGDIKGGVFKGAMTNDGIIMGGSFYGIVENRNTISPSNDEDAVFFGDVKNPDGFAIDGGTFKADVENGGFIRGGHFANKDGTVINMENATISGGNFECAVENRENACISEYNGVPTFSGTVSNSGYIYVGSFNQCTIINNATGEIGAGDDEAAFKPKAYGCTIDNYGSIWAGFDVTGTESKPSSLNNHGAIRGGQYDQYTEVTNSGIIEGGIYFGTVVETTESDISIAACVRVLLNPGDNAIFNGENELLILMGQSIAWDRSQDRTPGTPTYPDGLRACTGWSKQSETTLFDFSTPILEETTLVAQWTGATPVTSAQELKDALNSGAEGIVIAKSFDIDETITIPSGKNVTLNALNGSQITGGTLEVSQGATLNANCNVDCNVVNKGTIENGSFSGTVTNEGTIENGGFTGDVTNESNGTVKHGFFRKLTNKGTIEDAQVDDTLTNSGTVKSGKFNNVTNKGTIENGMFDGTLTNSGTVKDGMFNNVTNEGTIDGGTFTGTAVNEASGTIKNGSFNDLTNKGTIDGGTFTGTAVNEASGTIKNGLFNDLTNKGTIEGGSVDGTLTNSGTIAGGIFNNVNNTSTGIIKGGVFTGTVSNEGTILDSACAIYTLDTDGGEPMEPLKVLRGQKVSPPADPVKAGCIFIGWYDNGVEFDFNLVIAADNCSLKAKWAENIYTVTFDVDGMTTTANVQHGKTVDRPADPTKEGFTFAGWYNGETVYDFTAPVTASMTLTAKWAESIYTVTFDVDGVTTTANVQHGKTVDKPADPTKEGFTFAGWYNGETVYDFTAPVTANMTLTAKWQDADAPVVTSLTDGKTYCGPVTFSVSANLTRAKGDVSVTVNGTALEPDAHGAYTLQPAAGTQKVVATNTAGKSAVVTVTVNDGHTWGTWTSNGDDTHTHTCTISGCTETEKASCSGGTATCTDKPLCAACGAAYATVDANAHASLTHVPAKDSTTTEAGNIEYWYCEQCSKCYADADATKEIDLADTTLPLQPEVPKTGDSAPLVLWACLMLVGMSGLVAMRKRSHS